MQIAADRITK